MIFWIQIQLRGTLSAIIPFSKYLFMIPAPLIFQMARAYDAVPGFI